MSSRAEHPIGELLGGRYRIVRLLGEGGMGAVYEAVQEGLGRRVAIKLISKQLAEHPDYLERFRREAQAAAQLGHPNIAQVTDFHHQPGETPFMVMEYLEGEPLLSTLNRGRLEPGRAVAILRQMLAGLAVAHDAGFVHRDLKPGNVFLVPVGGGGELVKVLDFGIAKLMDTALKDRLTATGVMIGTPRYAAPEQIRDSSKVGPSADLYSAGVLLYCMLAGRPPFLTRGAQLMVDVETKEPEDPRVFVPELDAGLVEVLRRSMQKAPGDRHASAALMSAALAPWAVRPSGGFVDGATHPTPALEATAPATAGVTRASPRGGAATAPNRAHAATTEASRARPMTAPTKPAKHSPPAASHDAHATAGAIPSAVVARPVAAPARSTVGETPHAMHRAPVVSAIPDTGGRGQQPMPALGSAQVAHHAPPTRGSTVAPAPAPSSAWNKIALALGVAIVVVITAALGGGAWLYYGRSHGHASAGRHEAAARATAPPPTPGPTTDPLAGPAPPAPRPALPTPPSVGIPACDAWANQACACRNRDYGDSQCNVLHTYFEAWTTNHYPRARMQRECVEGIENDESTCGPAEPYDLIETRGR